MGSFIQYLTPVFAIYLVVVSGFAKRFIRSSVKHSVMTEPSLAGREDFIASIATGWSTRLSLFNAMLAAMISLMVKFSKTKNYDYLVGGLVAMLFVLVPTFWFLVTTPAESLDTTYTWFHMKYATVLRVILVAVNVLLIVAIRFGQPPAASASVVLNQLPAPAAGVSGVTSAAPMLTTTRATSSTP